MDNKRQEQRQTTEQCAPQREESRETHRPDEDRERTLAELNAALERDLPALFEYDRAA